MKNPAAVALGRLIRGIPKRITPGDRQRRRDWARGLSALRAIRHPPSAIRNPQ